jgi:putative ABC transport system permease protein
MLQLLLATRYLLRRRLRSTLTVLAITLAVTVVMGMNVSAPAALQTFQSGLQAATQSVDVTITREAGRSFPAQLADRIAALKGVRDVTGVLRTSAIYPPKLLDPASSLTASPTVFITGVDPEAARALYSPIIEQGRWLQRGDSSAVVIDQKLADKFHLSVGDRFPILASADVTKLAIVGVYSQRAPSAHEVFLPLARAQRLYDQRGRINLLQANLSAVDAAGRAAAEATIAGELDDSFEVNATPPDASLVAQVRGSQGMYSILSVLALFMGGFIVFNTFRTAAAERRRETGMLRAMGATGTDVTGIFLVESLIEGAAGTVLGGGLGYLMACGILAFMPTLPGMDTRPGLPSVTFPMLLTTAGLGIGVTVLAGLIPVLSANRVSPIKAIQQHGGETRSHRAINWLAVAGVACILVASLALLAGNTQVTSVGAIVFLVGILMITATALRPITAMLGVILSRILPGSMTRLARENLLREPGRAALTASALMLSLAIIIALNGMIESLRHYALDAVQQAMRADYLFTRLGSGQTDTQDRLAEQLRALKGVERIATIRWGQGTVDVPGVGRKRVSLRGIDPAAVPVTAGLTFLRGDRQAALAALDQCRCMIANIQFEAQLGVRLGDIVVLRTPNGPAEYQVAAIANDMTNTSVLTVYISQDNLARDFDATQDMVLEVYLKPSANRAVVEQQLRIIASRYPQFDFGPVRDLFDLLQNMIFQMANALYLLLAVITLPSLVALTNTLIIGMMERTREIGVLRSLGVTRAQVVEMVLAEAILLATAGTGLGILAGLYLGRAMMPVFQASGVPASYAISSRQLLVASAIGLLVGLFASIAPARQIARINVIEALRHE